MNADDEDVFASVENSNLEENLFGNCLSNPTNSIDEDGNLALAIGGSLVASASSVTATNWWNPAGWVAATVFVGVMIISFASANPAPYARPNQKSKNLKHGKVINGSRVRTHDRLKGIRRGENVGNMAWLLIIFPNRS